MNKKKRIKNFKKNNKKLYKKIDLNLDYFEEICSNKFLNRFEKEIRDKNNIYFSKLNV